jgi:hypothetical protein
MIVALIGIELHVHQRDLLPQARLDVMKYVCIFYGSYLGGILTFWYFRPFRPGASESLERVRFAIALAGTVILNFVVVAFCWKMHLPESPQGNVLESVTTGLKLAGYLSFLVGPANLYYFGIKPKPILVA